jgi:hypothetical protein
MLSGDEHAHESADMIVSGSVDSPDSRGITIPSKITLAFDGIRLSEMNQEQVACADSIHSV